MDFNPPADPQLRNIIDKLAEFVARNGPEFEAVTKQKQLGNPKFEFLFGGEHSKYYQYRVAAEQEYMQQQSQMSQHAYQQQNQPAQSHYNQMAPAQTAQQQQQQQQPDNGVYNANHHSNAAQPLWNNHHPPAAIAAQQNGNNQLALNIKAQIEAMNLQQKALHEQIRQSEGNLSAQHTAMRVQQAKQIEEAINVAQKTQLETQAEEQSIVLAELDGVLQPIIESCTKDSISAGKNWILQHSTDNAKNNVILQYLLKKALSDGSTFQLKLHLIYLVNDILHHCVRKGINELRNSLENVVIPMFCSAELISTTEQRQKLTKLLSLWESKAKFFDACVISKLKSADSSMQEYKTNLQNFHHEIIAQITKANQTLLDSYQQQHQTFAQHGAMQIAQLEQQKQQLEQQLHATTIMQSGNQQPQQPPYGASQQQQQKLQIPSLMSQKVSPPIGSHPDSVKSASENDDSQSNVYQQTQQQQQQQAYAAGGQYGQPNYFVPDFSKPPPVFNTPQAQMSSLLPQQTQYTPMANNVVPTHLNNETSLGHLSPNVDIMAIKAALQMVQQQQQHLQQMPNQQQDYPLQLGIAQSFEDQGAQQDLLGDQFGEAQPAAGLPLVEETETPTAPYYALPAGLMTPLVRLGDFKYRPIDPADLRMPVLRAPDERLTNALTAFYAAPSHDRPRDNEGWEKLGLYEYYKAKNSARKEREEALKSGACEDNSRSPSPIVLEKAKVKKISKRYYKSRSPTRSRSRSPYNSRTSTPRSSPLRSPPQHHGRNNRDSANRNSSSNRSNRQRRDRDSYNNKDNRADRSASSSSGGNNSSRRVERDRSPTPPSFLTNNFAKANEFIEETNKGHQMLMKMGWAGSGTGLGAKKQGIDQPIAAGEVRDRQDMYKGVGVNLNDPFESFRKNKGVAFVHRMRSREDKS